MSSWHHKKGFAPGQEQESLRATSRHFIVAVSLHPHEKPTNVLEALKQGVRKEYPVKYLEEIGAVPTAQNIALVEKEMGIDKNCKVSAAWKSRGSVHDCLYIAPNFPNQSCDNDVQEDDTVSGSNAGSHATGLGDESMKRRPADFAIVNAALVRQEQEHLEKLKAQRYARPQATRYGRNGRARKHRTVAAMERTENIEDTLAFLDHGLCEESVEPVVNRADRDELRDSTMSQSGTQQPAVIMKLRFTSIEDMKSDLAALDEANGAQSIVLTMPRSRLQTTDVPTNTVSIINARMLQELSTPFREVFAQQSETLGQLCAILNDLCLHEKLNTINQPQAIVGVLKHACMFILQQVVLSKFNSTEIAKMGVSTGLPVAHACREGLQKSFRKSRNAQTLFALRVLTDIFFFSVYRNTMAEIARCAKLAADSTNRSTISKDSFPVTSLNTLEHEGTTRGTGVQFTEEVQEYNFGPSSQYRTSDFAVQDSMAMRESLRRKQQYARTTELSKLYNAARCEMDMALCVTLDPGMLLRLDPSLSGHQSRRLPSIKAICGHGQGSSESRLRRLRPRQGPGVDDMNPTLLEANDKT